MRVFNLKENLYYYIKTQLGYSNKVSTKLGNRDKYFDALPLMLLNEVIFYYTYIALDIRRMDVKFNVEIYLFTYQYSISCLMD